MSQIQLAQLPIPVLVLDEGRKIVECNGAAAALLGRSPDRMVGNDLYEVCRPRRLSGEDLLRDGWPKAARLPTARRIVEQEIVVRRNDTTEVRVVIDGGYLRGDDRSLKGAIVMLRPRHRGSRQPTSGIRIVSTVSHELRSPLTSVRGYTSLLLKRWDSVADDDRKMMLGQVDRDARRISRLIGELLDISRIETGRLQLNREEVQIDRLVPDVIENVTMSYPDLRAQVVFSADFPPAWVDADKIEQVLTNLIENACKYASPDGVLVSGLVENEAVVVEVRDNGPGIPAADMPRLFQQFFKSREGRPTGTGLGLWISRGLIEAHGGTLEARSVEGDGTTFRFSVPLKPDFQEGGELW